MEQDTNADCFIKRVNYGASCLLMESSIRLCQWPVTPNLCRWSAKFTISTVGDPLLLETWTKLIRTRKNPTAKSNRSVPNYYFLLPTTKEIKGGVVPGTRQVIVPRNLRLLSGMVVGLVRRPTRRFPYHTTYNICIHVGKFECSLPAPRVSRNGV